MSTEPSNTTYEDIPKTCADCNMEFVHSAADQERYAQKGFTHHPKRCPTCREKRRAQSAAGGGGNEANGNRAPAPAPHRSDDRPRRSFDRGDRGDRDRGPRRGGFGGGGGRGPRQDFAATCAACGAQTTVPFKPTEGRPVYCRDCFRANRPPR